jgi:putative hydrolase of the HAD superfamily
MVEIKNIIFDLGGVIINIDFNLTINAFKKLGIRNFEKAYSKLKQSDLFDQFEVGKISPNEFRNQLIKFSSQDISADQVDTAWNALLLDIPIERFELLEKHKKNYRLFVLSNTNEIHLQEFNAIVKRASGHTNLAYFFDRVYYSHEIGFRKPNEKAFEWVLRQNSLLPNETLFIDDLEPNIKAASSMGIHTLHLTHQLTINQVFDEYRLFKTSYLTHLSGI